MDKLFLEDLDNALQDQDESHGLVEIDALSKAIADKEQELQSLRQQLARHSNKLCMGLAGAISDAHPGLNLNLGGGKCTTSYHSRVLSMYPNLQAQNWTIDPTHAGKSFRRRNGECSLSMNVQELAHKIVDFFRQQYKTLQHEGFDIAPESTINMGPAVKRKGMSGYGPGPHYE